MKKILQITLSVLLLVSVKSHAQESILKEINYSDLQKYIDLARVNFPQMKIAEAKKEFVKTGIPIAQAAYFDIFNASYFYRPENKSVLDPVNPYNFNGFQFGVSVNVGNLLQKPFEVKRAKADYKVAVLEAQQNDKAVEMEVKRRYYDYIRQISQLKIATKSAQDNRGVSESLRNKFEKGEITLDAYNQSRLNQSTSESEKVEVEINYLKAKDLLEEIIGVKLSDIK
jgi:outer membrane protein TolC